MREEKQLLLDEVKEKFEECEGFVVARYEGLGAVKAREFRGHIAEVNGEFEVVRKRIFIKAAKAAGLELNGRDYEGHIGIIFAKEDPLRVLKTVVKYGEESIRLLGGRIEGEFVSAEEVVAMAKLPPLEELRAQVLGLIQNVMGGVISVLQAPMTGVMHCLEAKAKKDS